MAYDGLWVCRAWAKAFRLIKKYKLEPAQAVAVQEDGFILVFPKHPEVRYFMGWEYKGNFKKMEG